MAKSRKGGGRRPRRRYKRGSGSPGKILALSLVLIAAIAFGLYALYVSNDKPAGHAPGTAQTEPTRADPDGPEGPLPRVIVRDGDHSWFVVLAGPKGGAPRYSIAVMMEYAGSGGKVSGPIVNQIIHALVAEGYLPGGAEGQRGERREQRAGESRGS